MWSLQARLVTHPSQIISKPNTWGTSVQRVNVKQALRVNPRDAREGFRARARRWVWGALSLQGQPPRPPEQAHGRDRHAKGARARFLLMSNLSPLCLNFRINQHGCSSTCSQPRSLHQPRWAIQAQVWIRTGTGVGYYPLGAVSMLTDTFYLNANLRACEVTRA